MTRQAMENDKKKKESIQINIPKQKPQQSFINPFPEMNVNVGYGDSNLGNGYSTSKYKFAGDSNPITYTLLDLLGAPLNRLGKKVGIQQTVPTLTMRENNFNEADTEFLREAVRRAEQDVPEFKGTTRKRYFEENPDSVVKYHFTGKTSKEHPISGYQKFFGVPYGGVMTSGVSNALSKPIYRMQNTLGGFDVIYTKDNAKIQDDWGYHSGAGNWQTVGGIIKKIGETFGTKRKGEPVIIKTNASFPYLEDEKFAKRTFTE